MGLRALLTRTSPGAGMVLSRELRVWDMERWVGGVVEEGEKAQRSTVWAPWGFVIFSFWEVKRGVWTPERAGMRTGDIGGGGGGGGWL